MNRSLFSSLPAVLLALFALGAEAQEVTPPDITGWQLVEKKDLTAKHSDFGTYTLGTHSVYQNPQDQEYKYAATKTIVGSEEIIVMAFFTVYDWDNKTGRHLVAIKTEDGKWVGGGSNDYRWGIGVDYENQTIVRLYTKLVSMADGSSINIRTTAFSSALSPVK